MIVRTKGYILLYMKRHHIIAIIGLLILIAGYMWSRSHQSSSLKTKGVKFTFTCKNEKLITATFYPPDDMQIDLVLSDGRDLSLIHAPAASGARYINLEESIVFWNKGNTAFLEENKSLTFEDCMTTTPQ